MNNNKQISYNDSISHKYPDKINVLKMVEFCHEICSGPKMPKTLSETKPFF